MVLNPNSQDDGPVKVWLDNGDVLTFDRWRHTQSGMVEFYDVEHAGENRIRKGERAKAYPVSMIEEMNYIGYGD